MDVVPAFSGIISAWLWLLMVLDVAFPGPKDFGNPCCFCISNSDPHHFPRCFRSTGSSTSLVWWENLRETPMFHGNIMCNPLFPVKIFPPQPIHGLTGNSFHRKIRFFFSQVTRAIPGLPWTQDWVNVLRILISLSENIWKQKTFSGAKGVLSLKRLTAFDRVWHCFVIILYYSIGERDPTWHVTWPFLKWIAG